MGRGTTRRCFAAASTLAISIIKEQPSPPPAISCKLGRGELLFPHFCSRPVHIGWG